MCGIAGYSLVKLRASSTPSLSSAVSSLAHRGPDDMGVFEDFAHGIGLAQTRLSILDLSPLGHQPMFSPDGRVALVFNGEIYNYRELRAELEAAGHQLCGLSDTEVLLHVYLSWREHDGDLAAMLRRLNGIFTFAVWDADRKAMLLVRDAFGVKPLYIREGPQGFFFASEIKALPLENLTLDAAAIDRYLSFLWCPGEGTPAAEIRKLGPGEAIWVADGVARERFKWFQLPLFAQPSFSAASMSAEQAIKSTKVYLRQAVHRQLVADVPVGAFLSGGLDSSAIVAFAREQNPDIRCFTIDTTGGADDGAADDLPYARRVAEHLNVALEVVRIDATRMAQDLEGMVAQLDEPLADPAPLNVLYISRLAREQGIKVLLSGAGGDDLFTGYRRHQALMTERFWKWVPTPLLKGMEQITAALDQRNILGRRLRKLFEGAALDGDARLVNYFAWNRRQDLMALYTPEFQAALDEVNPGAPMLDFLASLPVGISKLECMLALEQRFFLADHNLTYTDKMSMAAGVEVRVPFLDLELVEFASRIPSEFKQRGSEGKWVLKKAMEPFLPREIIYRPKTGFGAPLRRWMRFELRELLGDVLSVATLRQRGLFDPGAVQKLIADNDSGRVDASYTLLSLLCIELWCRRFIDQVPTYAR